MDKRLKNDSAKYLLFLLCGIIIGILSSFLLNISNNDVSVGKNQVDNKLLPVIETYETLKEKYYKDIDDDVLINGAVDGMMKSLDDKHSMFFNLDNKNYFETELSGTYYGIGAEIKTIENGFVIINRIFDDSPAEKTGLKPGDVFVSIDGESVNGKSITDISKNLRSSEKNKSLVVVRRDNKEISFEIQKDNVTMLSIDSEMLDNKIGYIGVSIFGEYTDSQFRTALDELEKNGMKSLIIDLRGNGGGYLSTVSQMVSEFLDSNTVFIQMRVRNNVEKYRALNNNVKKYKVVILVNEESASASEIMTSALKEQYGAIVVGKKTYGKGTVQETKDLSNGTMIKYTIEEWLTSLGESINDVGIKPDYEVDLSEKYMKTFLMEDDDQLNKAIELAK